MSATALRASRWPQIDTGLGRAGFEALHEQLRSRGVVPGRGDLSHAASARRFRSKWWCSGLSRAGANSSCCWRATSPSASSAEEALTESAERFRALFDESPVAALLLDAGFRVIGVNRAASDTVGYSIDELTGTRPENWFVLRTIRRLSSDARDAC